MYIKINGLVERVLIQLIDDDFKFEELVRASSELLITEQEKVDRPRTETTYYVGLNVEFIAEAGYNIILTQSSGNSFTLPKSVFDTITII